MTRSMALTSLICIAWSNSTIACAKEPTRDDALGVIRVPSTGRNNRAPVATITKIHPNGKVVATVGDDHIIRFWNLASEKQIGSFDRHGDRIHAIAFSPNGRRLVSGGNERLMLVWDLATGSVTHSIPFDQSVDSIAFSNDGRLIAVGGFEKAIWLYDAETLQIKQTLIAPCSDIRAVAFSTDDRRLACGGRNGRVRVFDLLSGTSKDVQAHRQRIRSIIFSVDDSLMLSAGEDGEIKAWNTDDNVLKFKLRSEGKVLALVAIGKTHVATGGSDNCVSIWNLETQNRIARLSGHKGSVVSLDYRNGTLLSGAYDETIRIWPTDASLNTKVTQN